MTRAILILSLLCAWSPSARAEGRKIFLNGIDLSNVEVSVHEFNSCTVKFDKDGNVHINAPGYDMATIKDGEGKGKAKVKVKGKAKAKWSKPKLTKRYFLVNKGLSAGKVQFDVAVYINGKKVRTVRSGVRNGVIEVTKHMKAGKNRLKLVVRKNLGKAKKRASSSSSDEIEIVLGIGTLADGSVTIRKTVVSYERNASETGRFSDSFDVQSE